MTSGRHTEPWEASSFVGSLLWKPASSKSLVAHKVCFSQTDTMSTTYTRTGMARQHGPMTAKTRAVLCCNVHAAMPASPSRRLRCRSGDYLVDDDPNSRYRRNMIGVAMQGFYFPAPGEGERERHTRRPIPLSFVPSSRLLALISVLLSRANPPESHASCPEDLRVAGPKRLER